MTESPVSLDVEAGIGSDQVTIKNVRDFRWEEDGTFAKNYETREYALEDLSGVWFGVDPFDSSFSAHTFLSFSFEESENLVISVEARMKKGQEYGFLKGATWQFGLIYVVADEKDILGERVVSQDNYIQLYPVDTEIDTVRSVFIDMLERANKIKREPESYNIIWNNCSRNLLFHADKFVDNSPNYFQTMYFCLCPDNKLYEWGFIQTDESIEDMKKTFRVENYSPVEIYSENFSLPFRD